MVSKFAVNSIASEVLGPVEHCLVLTGTEVYVIVKWKTKCDGVYLVFR